MEIQTQLFQGNERHELTGLQPSIQPLENEKERFITNLCDFIEPLNFESMQLMGRPKSNLKDILKALCIMSYNGMSYK